MPRWFWFVPMGFLAAFVAFHGLKLGITRANLTETDVINHYAGQYLEDVARLEGQTGALTDCLAVPGDTPGIWLEVRCTPPEGSAFLYGVRRSGQLAYQARDGEAPET